MPVTMSQRQRILVETTAARDKAEALLEGLLDARRRSEANLRELRRDDALKAVTGASAMDNAIASTKRMVDTLTRAIDEVRRDLTDEDLALLNEISESG